MCQREIGSDIRHLFVWYHDWRQQMITVLLKFVRYAEFVISLCRFLLEYIFFILRRFLMRMCHENSVITRLSRRAFMDFLIFPSLFFKSNSRLLSFERIIKRLQWQEYTRNEKEKLFNKRSTLASAADILDGKEFQI